MIRERSGKISWRDVDSWSDGESGRAGGWAGLSPTAGNAGSRYCTLHPHNPTTPVKREAEGDKRGPRR